MVFRLFRRSANRDLIDRLRGEIVAAARDPVLFTEYGIEDSLQGRLALALHAALILRQLNRSKPPAPEMAQDLTDAIFLSFDTALQEMGVGDTGLRTRMRTIAEAFRGRATAYDLALSGGTPQLTAALARNVYDGHGIGEACALCGSRQPSLGQCLARGIYDGSGSISTPFRYSLEHILKKVARSFG